MSDQPFSFIQQTGWWRIHPKQLCQGQSYLDKVRSHSFNPADPDFRQYALDRLGLDIDPGRRPIFSMSWREVEQHILRSPGWKYQNGGSIPAEDRQADLKVYQRLFAQLQDCWDLYRLQGKQEAVETGRVVPGNVLLEIVMPAGIFQEDSSGATPAS